MPNEIINKSWFDVIYDIINTIISKLVGDKKQQKIDDKNLNDELNNIDDKNIIDSHKKEDGDISNIQDELNDKFK